MAEEWKSLKEIACGYKESYDLISSRIKELRKLEKESTDVVEREIIKRRILDLKPLRQECKELATMLDGYYERSRSFASKTGIRSPRSGGSSSISKGRPRGQRRMEAKASEELEACNQRRVDAPSEDDCYNVLFRKQKES